MVKVLAIANQKGGVGKSTLCIQTAFYLTLKLNKRVLCIDMDGQGNTSSRLAPKEISEGGKSTPFFSGTKTSDLFSVDIDEITVTSCPSGVDLIHATKNDNALSDMEAVPLLLALNPARHLKEFIKNYDYVLIDCPPSKGRSLIAALALTTHVVCPIKLSGFAIDGVEGLLETIISIKRRFNQNLNVLGLLVNDMDRSVNHQQSYDLLKQDAGHLLFENKIMHRSPLDRATTLGIPIWELPYGHVAAKEVETVIKEIIAKANK